MFENLLSLIQQPWFSLLIGTMLAAYGIYQSVKSRPRRQLRFVKFESAVLGVSNPTWHKRLDIKYDGIQVQQLTSARLGLWNAGNETIYGNQIVSDDPLRAQVAENSKLLAVVINGMTRPMVKAEIEKDQEHRAIISFDFLDPDDGFVIHTAQSSPQGELVVKGTIREISAGPQAWSTKAPGGKLSWMPELLFGPALAFLFIYLAGYARNILRVQENSTVGAA